MRKDKYLEMYMLEKDYWWHIGRRRLVLDAIKRYKKGGKIKIMDFGCGTGAMIEEMQKYGKVLGVDTSSESIKFCSKRGIKNLEKINAVKDLKAKNFDFIVAMDVIEHIEDEDSVLCKFHDMLNEKGKIILTVPAYKFLWSYWDDIHGHKRRYAKKTLRRVVKKNDFKIRKISYYYSFILPIAIIFRAIKSQSRKKNGSSDFVKVPRVINSLFIFLSHLERIILSFTMLPFGLSIVCVAQKK